MGLLPSTRLLWKAVVVSVLPQVLGACWEGIPVRWISREQPLYPLEASLPPRGREACATDDRGLETAEVKGSWSGGRFGEISSPEGGQAVPKIVTGIPEAADAGNPEALTEVKGSWSGGRLRVYEAAPKMAKLPRS